MALRVLTKRHKGNAGFHNNQIFALCSVSTRAEFQAKHRVFARSFPIAAKLLGKLEKEVYAQYAMLENNISCFGHITSNIVEGFNGVIGTDRRLHPLLLIDALLRRVDGYYSQHAAEARAWREDNLTITPWAQNARQEQESLVQDGEYSVRHHSGNGSGECYIVEDRRSRSGLRHQVCTDPRGPDCTQCSTFRQFLWPCRHLIVAVGTNHKERLNSDYFATYYHPAYLVDNVLQGYDQCSINIPVLPFKKPPIIIDLCSGEEEDDDEDEEGDPWNDFRERVESSSSSSHAPKARPKGPSGSGIEITKMVMLPPKQYTLEKFQNSRKGNRGRRRGDQRFASAGQEGGGGKRPARKRKKTNHHDPSSVTSTYSIRNHTNTEATSDAVAAFSNMK